VHTNETVRSIYKDSHSNHEDIVGQLSRIQIEQFKQNNLLGNISVTEAGKIQQMIGATAKGVIKELKETILKETLQNFLSSSSLMDFRKREGQSRL